MLFSRGEITVLVVGLVLIAGTVGALRLHWANEVAEAHERIVSRTAARAAAQREATRTRLRAAHEERLGVYATLPVDAETRAKLADSENRTQERIERLLDGVGARAVPPQPVATSGGTPEVQ